MNAPFAPSLLVRRRARAARSHPRRHRGLQRRPESAQGQPRRRRLLRRERQGAAARVREARGTRADRAGRAALLSPDRRHSRVRPRSAGAAVRPRFGRDRRGPRGDRAGARRHRRAQGRRRFPAPLRAGRAGVDQRPELGEPPRAVRRRRLHRQHLPLLRRHHARPRFRRDDRRARADPRRVGRRAARVLPQSDRRRSDARAMAANHRRRPRPRPRAVPRHRLPGLRRRHRSPTAPSCARLPPRPARCSWRARSPSRSRSTASASARCPSSPPTRTKPRACCRR